MVSFSFFIILLINWQSCCSFRRQRLHFKAFLKKRCMSYGSGSVLPNPNNRGSVFHFVNHSLCMLSTILCSCLEWSKWCIKIFHKSLVLLACGFLDEFDIHDVSVFFFVSSNWLPFCITPISKCSHSISISMEKVSI